MCLQLFERFGLDRTNPLAGDLELSPDLLQGVAGVHADSEAHLEHALFAPGQAGQHPLAGLAQVGLDNLGLGASGNLFCLLIPTDFL